MKSVPALCALVLLTACGGGIEENSGVTAEEAAALDETEAMLDEPAQTGELPVTSDAATD